MKTEEFIKELVSTLEIEEREQEITLETNLKDLDDFDSLSVLSIIAMIDKNFGKQLSAKQFAEINTIRNLIEKIGIDHFK